MNSTRAVQRLRISLTALVATVAIAGCSQIDALAPVSGGPLQTVRVGVLNLLVREGVPILVAPVCTEEETQFTCVGSTLDDREIRAEATLTQPYLMSVTIGTEVLYDGDVQSIIDESAQETP